LPRGLFPARLAPQATMAAASSAGARLEQKCVRTSPKSRRPLRGHRAPRPSRAVRRRLTASRSQTSCDTAIRLKHTAGKTAAFLSTNEMRHARRDPGPAANATLRYVLPPAPEAPHGSVALVMRMLEPVLIEVRLGVGSPRLAGSPPQLRFPTNCPPATGLPARRREFGSAWHFEGGIAS
jgi:hypothetical protein